MSITLPKLPQLAQQSIDLWVMLDNGKYVQIPFTAVDVFRARDIEVAKAVLEGAADFCTDEYHTPDGWGVTTADRRCAAAIRALEIKHE